MCVNNILNRKLIKTFLIAETRADQAGKFKLLAAGKLPAHPEISSSVVSGKVLCAQSCLVHQSCASFGVTSPAERLTIGRNLTCKLYPATYEMADLRHAPTMGYYGLY